MSSPQVVAGPCGIYMPMVGENEHVKEMQGLYGPFTMAERVVQKIWLRRDFEQSGLRLSDGRALQIRAAGRWNLLGGPDFREARLAIEGVPVTGDVEVHFHSTDWHAHRHSEDPAYDNVALHVVLFPPDPGERRALRRDGGEIPTLVLLPWLLRGLEEYASDEALEKMTARDAVEKITGLATLSRPELERRLRDHARARWQMKVRFAALRIAKLGWTEAAHHAALEILGSRRNRAPMLAIATAHPLGEWLADLDPALLVAERQGQWQVQGIRPANQPLRRLRQYRAWVSAQPNWPEDLRRLTLDLTGGEVSSLLTAFARKQLRLHERRKQWAEKITASNMGGSRFDTLVCDGFLPLLADATKTDLFAVWFHWFLGDMPDEVRKAPRDARTGRRSAGPFLPRLGAGIPGLVNRAGGSRKSLAYRKLAGA